MITSTNHRLLLLLSLLVLLIASCQGGSDELEPHQLPEPGLSLELTERHEIPEFDYSIPYPEGWRAKTLIPVTIINELKSDHETAFAENQPVARGYEITVEHRDMAFMEELGLPDGATLQDLLELNKEFFPWQEPIEVRETQAFGVPALSVRAADRSAWGTSIMGFVDSQVFLLSYSAPSEKSLNAFVPTWDRIVDGIRPVDD